MRILITGSKGVIGSKLVKIFNEQKHFVFGIDLTHDFGEIGWEQRIVKILKEY